MLALIYNIKWHISMSTYISLEHWGKRSLVEGKPERRHCPDQQGVSAK